ELGKRKLAAQIKRLDIVELFRPVDREAKARSAKQPRVGCDPGRVGPEMRMDMGQPQRAGAGGNTGAFGQIDDLSRQAGFPGPRPPPCQPQSRGKLARLSAALPEQIAKKLAAPEIGRAHV